MFSEYNEYFNEIKADHSKHTIRLYTRAIDRFLNHFEIKSCEDLKAVTRSDIVEYRLWLKALPKENILLHGKEVEDKERSNSSVNSEMRTLKSFFNWLSDENRMYIQVNPFVGISELKIQKKVPSFFTDEEVIAIYNSCTRLVDKLMWHLLIYCGIRRSELVYIKMENIVGNKILIEGKGNKQDEITLRPDTLELLEEYIARRNKYYGKDCSPYLFISKSGHEYNPNTIWSKIRSLGLKAGISEERMKKLHPHSTRHTTAVRQINSGTNMKTIQRILRHSNMATTANIYAHVTDPALEEAFLNQKSIGGK